MNNRSTARMVEVEGTTTFDSRSSSRLNARRTRRRRHFAWAEADIAAGGLYTRNLEEIARHYPTLTPMELRICTLVKAMLPSWRIAEILGVCEETVENHRVNIRRKLEIHIEQSLYSALLK